MSGGTFNYHQYTLTEMADVIQHYIDLSKDDSVDEWHYKPDYNEKTIAIMQSAVNDLHRLSVICQRIDWLLASDDSEETFHERLKNDLNSLSAIVSSHPE